MNLYELTGQMLALQEMMSDPDIDPEIIKDTMESMDGDIEEKLEGYGKIMRNYETTVNALDEEIKRLQERKKFYDNRVKKMKNDVKSSLIAMNKKSVRTTSFLYTVKPGVNAVVIDDEDLVPAQFREPVPDKIDKAAIKKYLNEHGTQNFAHLQRGDSSLAIK